MDDTSFILPTTSTIPKDPFLKSLSGIDQVIIRQRVGHGNLAILKIFNEREILNEKGEILYVATEENNWIYRNILRSNRAYTLTITDNCGIRVMRMCRRMVCTWCWTPCWVERIMIYSPPEKYIGSVHELFSVWKVKFGIEDAVGNAILKVKGTSRCIHVRDVINSDGTVVGVISKNWAQMLKIASKADDFRVTFLHTLNVQWKALVIGAAFLINTIFFEGCPITYSNSPIKATQEENKSKVEATQEENKSKERNCMTIEAGLK